jgi:hypothetical protein
VTHLHLLTELTVQWMLICFLLTIVTSNGARDIQRLQELTPHGPTTPEFGHQVAISGDTIVVSDYFDESNHTGVNGDDTNSYAKSSGAVYVFVRNGTEWVQEAYIKASNPDELDFFGTALSISGDTMVVGAYNEDSSAKGINGDQHNDDAMDSGAAYVFVRNGTTWTQQAYLKASNSRVVFHFGYSVSISEDTIVVGAPDDDSNATGVNGDQNNLYALESGAAYVFVRNESTWFQQAYLKASNTEPRDHFGTSVSISGDTIVVGAPYEASNATGVNGDQSNNDVSYAGAAYVFVREGDTWTQQAYLKASNPGDTDMFGYLVCISGDTVAVSASEEDSNATGVNGDHSNDHATNSGAVYVFVRNGTEWTFQAYLKASNTGVNDQFGFSLSISGDIIIVGAWNEASSATGVNGDGNNNDRYQSGAAYIYMRNGTTWSHEIYLKHHEEWHIYFGWAVAVDEYIVVGDHGGANVFNITETTEAAETTGTTGSAGNVDTTGITSMIEATSGSALIPLEQPPLEPQEMKCQTILY